MTSSADKKPRPFVEIKNLTEVEVSMWMTRVVQGLSIDPMELCYKTSYQDRGRLWEVHSQKQKTYQGRYLVLRHSKIEINCCYYYY